MNKLLVISLIVSTTALTRSVSMAGDVFDSPGPGYYQQIERAFPKARKDVSTDFIIGTPIIHIVPSSLPATELPTLHFPDTKLPKPNDPTASLSSSASFRRAWAELIRFSIENSSVTFTGSGEKKPQ